MPDCITKSVYTVFVHDDLNLGLQSLAGDALNLNGTSPAFKFPILPGDDYHKEGECIKL